MSVKSSGRSKSKLSTGSDKPDLRRLAHHAEEALKEKDVDKSAIVRSAVEAIARSQAAAAEAQVLSTFLNEM
jgi:hypothetical protein